jgi:hypothetical protein
MNNCPTCGAALVNIIYGIPSKRLIDLAKTDDIVLGGTPSGPRSEYFCTSCNEEYSKTESPS